MRNTGLPKGNPFPDSAVEVKELTSLKATVRPDAQGAVRIKAENLLYGIGRSWHYKLPTLLFWSVAFILFGMGFPRRSRLDSKFSELTGGDSGDPARKA